MLWIGFTSSVNLFMERKLELLIFPDTWIKSCFMIYHIHVMWLVNTSLFKPHTCFLYCRKLSIQKHKISTTKASKKVNFPKNGLSNRCQTWNTFLLYNIGIVGKKLLERARQTRRIEYITLPTTTAKISKNAYIESRSKNKKNSRIITST